MHHMSETVRFLLRISSIILIKAFSTISVDFWKKDFVSFVLEFHEFNTFLKLGSKCSEER